MTEVEMHLGGHLNKTCIDEPVLKYLKENGLEQNGGIWELYVNDPGTVKPEEIETEIHYPVK